MRNYRKLLAAVVGLAVIIGNDFFNLGLDAETVGQQADSLIDAAVAFLTAIGVYQLRNDPA